MRTFPPGSTESGGMWPVSTSGGFPVEWRDDGKELFFINYGKVMARPVQSSNPGARSRGETSSTPAPGMWTMPGKCP